MAFGPTFGSFLGTLDQKAFFSMLVLMILFLMFLGSSLGVWGIENQAFGVRSIAKHNIPMTPFAMILGVLGINYS